MTGREFQLSEEPYEAFLMNELGVDLENHSWWTTEMKGWLGGESKSAQMVKMRTRRSYVEGFHPVTTIPLEARQTLPDDSSSFIRNEVGCLRISSWSEYYHLRRLPCDSPALLLLTFPLTLYYAIVEYGMVPCTVAKILQRRLRIHIVGVEKELNFLDLFQEVSFLLPETISLELVFLVRHDMLPASEKANGRFQVDLNTSLRVFIESGSYGDSLDPNFDCGSGPPDMVMAFNAGIFAYESWNSVIRYLDGHKEVVGVFTDYNEYSGVQCASLGGSRCRDSVRLNPFRQPRAMPGKRIASELLRSSHKWIVYSMNLPQFSNGFLYVFNEQELE